MSRSSNSSAEDLATASTDDSAASRGAPRRAKRAATAASGFSLSKTTVNFWLDALLLLIFCLLMWTAVITQFVFPPATRAEGWTLWGWTYEQWHTFQFGVVAAMAAAVLLHVMLHWSWVCNVAAGGWDALRGRKKHKVDEGMQTIYGVGTMIVLLNLIGIAVAAAVLTIQAPPL
ncbi:MAG: DUF4405 domain-containing protein [Pirellulaceae bacterium]